MMYSELVLNHKGKLSNKWSSYLSYYDTIFSDYENQPIRMLEIGIQNGGSLEIYAEYFKQARIIIGCDIDEKCSGLQFSDPRISVCIGDARDQSTLARIAHQRPFNIIIDDGSHNSTDIIINFLNLFPYLAENGIYIVEDKHFVYQQGLGFQKNNCFAFFKRLIDIQNLQFWAKSTDDIITVFDDFFTTRIDFTHLIGTIESIEFRNSIIGIRKNAQQEINQLGSQIIVGNVALVDPTPLQLREWQKNNASS